MRALNGMRIEPRVIRDGRFNIGQMFTHRAHPVDKYIIQRNKFGVVWQSLQHDYYNGPLESLSGELYDLLLTHGLGMDGQLRLPVTAVTPL